MNSFTYKDTAIIESEFDFSRSDKGLKFSGEVFLSTTISIPKNLENNRTVILTLDLSMGSKESTLYLHVISRSFFEIEGLVNSETLHDDVQAECYPKAGEVLSEKIAELTRLHIGKPLNIPIPNKF